MFQKLSSWFIMYYQAWESLPENKNKGISVAFGHSSEAYAGQINCQPNSEFAIVWVIGNMYHLFRYTRLTLSLFGLIFIIVT